MEYLGEASQKKSGWKGVRFYFILTGGCGNTKSISDILIQYSENAIFFYFKSKKKAKSEALSA